jgi:hypothetical protein
MVSSVTCRTALALNKAALCKKHAGQQIRLVSSMLPSMNKQEEKKQKR